MSATKHAQQIKQDSQVYLTEALFQLLQKKSLNEIKITELVNRAGVSRMAFYRNYQTLEDVLRQYFAPQIQHMFDNVILQQPNNVKLADMQAFFGEFTSQLRLSVDRNFEYIIRDLFTEDMSHYYAAWPKMNVVSRRYWEVFMTNGVYGIWREWLLNNQKESLEELHTLIRALQDSTEKAITNLP